MLTSSRALAQADPLASEARQRFQEGVALHDAKREEEAYGKFSQAYAILKAPAVIFNLARTEELTGRLLDAAAHFKQYLALPEQPKVTNEQRRQARDYLADVRSKLGHVQIVAPAGATIWLDGTQAGTAPLTEPVDVMPGSHRLEARLGAKSKSAVFSLAADQAQSFAFDLFEVPPPPPPSPTATLPAVVAPQRAESSGGASTPTHTWLALGFGVGALASLAAGAAFELSASNSASQAQRLRAGFSSSGPSPCISVSISSACQQLESADQSAHDKRTAADGFFVAGAAFTLATAVVLLWPRQHRNDTARMIFFSPTPTGFRVSGDF